MIGRVAAIAVIIGLAACASNKKKVELIYEEPVTNVWTDRALPPPQAAPPPADASEPAPTAPQTYPQAQVPPGNNPTPPPPAPMPQAGAAPVYPQTYPTQQQPVPSPQPNQQQPPPGAWRNAQPPPQPPPTGFPDPSVTTVVVPDQNPTTQTTLKRRTGWVRGGYD